MKENTSTEWRLLKRDGTFNVSRKGVRRALFSDFYHFSLTMRWSSLLGLIFIFYLCVNALFGTFYYLCGPDAILGSAPEGLARWLDCVFFSVQTFATIGFGKLSPNGLLPNLIVTFESLSGLLGFALATGLLFARFSKPTARVIFSRQAIVIPHDGVPSLIFRIANRRFNQIVDAEVSVVFSVTEKTKEGETYRNLYDLKLERSHSSFFALSWTIVHPIDSASPLFGISEEAFKKSDSETIVSLTGIDDTFSQTIHARFSYTPQEILWNHRFVDILDRTPGKPVQIDLTKIHDLTPR